MPKSDRLTYSIRPVQGGWAWRTFDPQGRVRGQGTAVSRALAAACVVRSIARTVDAAGIA